MRCRWQGLSKLLQDNAPSCVREHKFDSYFGRKIAVDASMHIYSFLVRFLAWCALGFPVVSSPTLPVRTGDV